MCGIFGIHFFDSQRPVNNKMVQQATDVMHHRGPDDAGYYVNRNIGLGHRRLSIIDLSSGRQPMSNEDGQIIVVYNGEIYNYKELQNELAAKGHKFRTDCDTEVIVHGYEEWGVECVQRFNGMFAFVLLDRRRNKVWVVRDRLGIKPLYYYLDDNVFICASEVKAILKTGLVSSGLNENVLDAYFSVGYVPGPETMFKGIKKVLPGHYLLLDRNRVGKYEYWDFADIEENSLGLDAAIEEIDALLSDCVEKRLMSDVPLGAFLSGGLDSSAVVALMSKMTTAPVNTFTVAYKQGYSEEKYAQIVADYCGTNHHVLYLEASDFSESLKQLLHFSEEPIVEPAAIALYHIAKKARKKAIVLLSGEGSDEVFAGYPLYAFMGNLEKCTNFIPRMARPFIRNFGRLLPKNKYKKYLDWLTYPLITCYQGTSSYLTPSLKMQLYSPDFLGSKSNYLNEQFSCLFNKVSGKNQLQQMLYVDTKTWLVDDLLLKADKMTMAASVELRVPFLDYNLIEKVTALSERLKIRKGEDKYLLKKIMEPSLPRQIIYRPKKGFPVPTDNWFKGAMITYLEDIIENLKKQRWFQGQALDKLLVNHRNEREDNSKMLMMLLVFDEWQRQYG